MTAQDEKRAIWKAFIPIFILFLGYGLGGLWWAAKLDASMSSLEDKVEKQVVDTSEENLRQWNRINAVEREAAAAKAQNGATTATLDALRDSVKDLRQDIRTNNELLREVLSSR